MNELALFTGGGGGLLASHLIGWHTVCAVEIDLYCRKSLFARMRDGLLPEFPIWDDIRTFGAWPYRGRIDVVTGGFPCQDISSAGKGVGIFGPRSGLSFHMLRVIAEVRPRFVLAENSPHLRTKGLGVILHEFAEMGYNAAWGVLGARHAGAPHRRDRLWIVAINSDCNELRNESRRGEERGKNEAVACDDGEKRIVADPKSPRFEKDVSGGDGAKISNVSSNREIPVRWPVEPDVGRVAHGVADRVDRIRALGNGQVPRVAAMAWFALSGVLRDASVV